MKKLIAILLILAMAVGMFAGCAAKDTKEDRKKSSSRKDDDDRDDDDDDDDGESKDDDDRENDEEDRDDDNREEIPTTVVYDGSPVTISFAHTMGSKLQDTLDYYIEEFNKLYPGITVEHEQYGGWSDIEAKISTEIIGGNAPNIAYCYPEHVANYKLSDSVVALDGFIESQEMQETAQGETVFGLTQEQKEDLSGFYGLGRVYGDGKMYSMPMSMSTEVLYYNKTFFEENGLSVPTNWEEMEEVCKQLKELDPKCVPLGYDSQENMFITFCEQYGYPYITAEGYGEEHFLFNNDQCKSFVKKLREWHRADYITTEAIYGSYTSVLFTELNKEVQHSYMCIGSSGAASYQIPENYAFEVGVAPLPQADPSNPKAMVQGPSLCIFQGNNISEQEIAASWLFVEFLSTNIDFQKEFSTVSGYMPVIRSVLKDDGYRAWLDRADGYENLIPLVIKACFEQADAYFTPPAFNGSSTARTQVGQILFHAMGDANPNIDKLFKDAYDECV